MKWKSAGLQWRLNTTLHVLNRHHSTHVSFVLRCTACLLWTVSTAVCLLVPSMGRKCEFISCNFFIFTKTTAKCTLCDYLYEPKTGSDLHSKSLMDHLKRKHNKKYKKAIEEAEQSTSPGQKPGQIKNFFSNTDSDSSQKLPRLHNITFHASKEYIQELAVETIGF